MPPPPHTPPHTPPPTERLCEGEAAEDALELPLRRVRDGLAGLGSGERGGTWDGWACGVRVCEWGVGLPPYLREVIHFVDRLAHVDDAVEHDAEDLEQDGVAAECRGAKEAMGGASLLASRTPPHTHTPPPHTRARTHTPHELGAHKSKETLTQVDPRVCDRLVSDPPTGVNKCLSPREGPRGFDKRYDERQTRLQNAVKAAQPLHNKACSKGDRDDS